MVDDKVAHLERTAQRLTDELKMVEAERRQAVSQVNRLQLLSRSQTAILRASLVSKIKQRDSLIDNAFELLLRHTQPDEDKEDVVALRDKWRKIQQYNAGIQNEPETLAAEVEGLRSENKRLIDQIKNLEAGLPSSGAGAGSPCSQQQQQQREQERNGQDQVYQAQVLLALQQQLGQLKAENEKLGAALSKQRDDSSKSSKTAAASDAGLAESHALIAHLQEEVRRAKTEMEAAHSGRRRDAEDLVALKEALAAANARCGDVEDQDRRWRDEREGLRRAYDAERQELEAKYEAELQTLRMEAKTSGALRAEVQRLAINTKSVASAFTALKDSTQQALFAAQRDLTQLVDHSIAQYSREQQAAITALTNRYRGEMAERKRLFNMLQELKGNVRVFARCRPPNERELAQEGGGAVCVSFPAEGEIEIGAGTRKERSYEFDMVFGWDSTQEEVYEEVSPLVTSMLDGYNVCIFAFGQTGCGKTHTMQGSTESPGVNIRALSELFEKSQARRGEVVDEIRLSILEIYNETIRDLLADQVGSKKLEIRQGGAQGQGMYVTDLTILPVRSLEEAKQLMRVGDQHRSSCTTNMNEHSSRSHLILTVYVTSRNVTSNTTTRAKLHLIDLAGSERVGKSGVTGQQLKEAQAINKSLSALGDVIASLASKQGFTPFRNSTLTYLLSDSLGGNSKCLMFVCVSPVVYNLDETTCSLQFASRVRSVELGKAQRQVVCASPVPSGEGADLMTPAGPSGAGTVAKKAVAPSPGRGGNK